MLFKIVAQIFEAEDFLNIFWRFFFFLGGGAGKKYFLIKMYLLKKTCIQVPSRVVERLKTYDLRKPGNIRKISKLHRIIAYCPVLLPKWKFFSLLVKVFSIFPLVRYFIWNLEFVPNIMWMIVDISLMT